MLRYAIGIALFAGLVAPAQACWAELAPGVLEADSPIIVRGKIVAIQVAKKGQMRADDIAEIEVAEIFKNDLKDVPLKVGDKFSVRMISTGNNAKMSTDLNYPLKTEAIWLIALNTKGEFRIDGNPGRKMAVDAKLQLIKGRGNVAEKVRRAGDVVADERLTQKEWVQRVIDEAKREAEARERYEAEKRDTREIAAELAKAEHIDAASMRRHQNASVDTRRSVLQIDTHEQPIRGERLVEVAEFLLANDPDDNIRTHAMCRLGYTDVKSTPRAGEVLAKALKDQSRDVRMFACQALGQRAEKSQVAAIRLLLNDEKRDVRFMAMGTLAKLGDKESLPAILKLYEGEKITPDNAWEFAESLSRLGEKKISLKMAILCMASDNWNVRYFAVTALRHVDSVEVIPTAMECLGTELVRIIAGEKYTGFDERIYQGLCDILAKKSGQNLGLDPCAWAKWWDTARAPYFAPALKIDSDAAKKAFSEYQNRPKGDK